MPAMRRRSSPSGELALVRLLRRRRAGLAALHALRVDHGAVELDDDGIDDVDAVVNFKSLLQPQYECGLRQSVRARGIRANHGRAAYFAGGMPGMRIDDVMVANAALVEEPLIIARRRNR